MIIGIVCTVVLGLPSRVLVSSARGWSPGCGGYTPHWDAVTWQRFSPSSSRPLPRSAPVGSRLARPLTRRR